jgi:antitoxin (DNA-binding transcriptional repressor) of toxin-antitoxin stability system
MAAFRASTYIRSALAGGCLLVAAVGSPSALQVAAPPDPRLESFDAAVARYAALRARIQEPLPDFDDPRRDDWTRLLMRRYLASAIRTARREAEPGAIFAPAAGTFREIIARAIYEVDIEGLVDLVPGEDGFVLDLALNEPVAARAMSPMPRPLLERLPPLPAAIEYRIAGGALILWDAHAEILIDALPDAFVAP